MTDSSTVGSLFGMTPRLCIKPCASSQLCMWKKSIFKSQMKIARDKWKHFFVGIAMGMVLQAFMSFLFPGRVVLDTIIVFILVIAISYGFELFSKLTGKGHHDLYDAVAGIIGGILGMVIILMLT